MHTEYSCSNLAIFLQLFLNWGLFKESRHTVRSNLAAVRHAITTHTCRSTHSGTASSLNPISILAACITLKPQFVNLLLNFYTHPTSPDPRLPHPSPCENVNKHCFYYCHCGKFCDITQPPSPSSSFHSQLLGSRPPGGQRAALWSVRSELQDVEVLCPGVVPRNRM